MSVNTKVNGQLVKSAGLYSVSTPIGMADIYSTEEKEVGLWANNKPLYQKSYYVDSLPSQAGTKVIATGLTGIEMCKLGECWSNGFGEINIVRRESASANTYGVGCWVAVTNGVPSITIEVGRDRSSIDAWITIQYTKTADTPWSGKFVPQGYGYVSSGDIYSYEERQIGVFADGKPLYQKTIYLQSIDIITSSSGMYYYAITTANYISNAELILGKTEMSYVITNGETRILEDVEQQGALTVLWSKISRPSVDAVVTLQYTKTTDVAGSGEYVPSGDKAVHYSTEEEVIGTWIDGKTLYQKQVTFTTSFSSEVSGTIKYGSSPNLSTLIPNIDNAFADAQHSFFEVNNVQRGFLGFSYIRESKVLNCYAHNSSSDVSAKIMLQYTKTS
jgi:hypothetical protein